jgi:acyl-CoA synthetase (NDP forming)
MELQQPPGVPGGERDLRALFDPASVAVVGASGDPAKWGHAVVREALRSARRPVHLVNRRGGTILGRPVARRITELDAPIELVVIAVPAAGFEAAVDDALAAGARAIVGITAGFAETGPTGRAVQARVAATVAAHGAVLVGPNCLGVVDHTTELYLTSEPFRSGTVALLSQSGNLALELDQRLAGHGRGFSRFVSIGNQADVTLVDLLDSCAGHEPTRAIAVYAEDVGDGRALAAAAARAGKPVVLLSAGGGAAAARSAASHTGALTSPLDVVTAACRDAGVHLVDTPTELTAVLVSLTGSRRAAGRRVAVLTDGGGHGAIAAGVAERAGLDVVELSADTQAALRRSLWAQSAVTNPVDLAGMGERDQGHYATAVATLLAAPDVDAVLMTGFFGGYSVSGENPLGTAERRAAGTMAGLPGPTPLVVQSVFPAAPSCRLLSVAGVPVFDAVEDAVRALVAVTGARVPAGIAPLPEPAPPIVGIGYFATRALLGAAGVPFPAAREVRTAERARAAAGELTGPFALKAVGLLHKSDAGGVRLGLPDADAVAAAFRELHARLGNLPYAVEELADLRDGVELIVGVKRDPRFGPVAMVGFGGVHTEVLGDIAFALAPLSAERAAALLHGLRLAPLLRGYRGRPPVDVTAAAEVIAAVTAVGAAHPEIGEIEVNPLLVRPAGVLALDVRCVLSS